MDGKIAVDALSGTRRVLAATKKIMIFCVNNVINTPVSYTHLDVYKRQTDITKLYLFTISQKIIGKYIKRLVHFFTRNYKKNKFLTTVFTQKYHHLRRTLRVLT